MKTLSVCLVVLPLLGACATDPYGNNVEARTMGGALAGAAAGLVVGGATGYAVKGPVFHGRRYYKDNSGYCYYVDASGVSHYDDPPVRC